LLYELWLARKSGSDATRSWLAERLELPFSAVDRIIHQLRTDVSPKAYITPKQIATKGKEGNATRCYQLSAKTLITEPRTAALMLLLRSYPRSGEHMVHRKSFTTDMAEKLGATVAEVSDLIDQGVSRKYIKEMEEPEFIVEAERTLYEEEYLRQVADHFDVNRTH
jgi:DNA-binding MarR family transcriptional regulator